MQQINILYLKRKRPTCNKPRWESRPKGKHSNHNIKKIQKIINEKVLFQRAYTKIRVFKGESWFTDDPPELTESHTANPRLYSQKGEFWATHQTLSHQEKRYKGPEGNTRAQAVENETNQRQNESTNPTQSLDRSHHLWDRNG